MTENTRQTIAFAGDDEKAASARLTAMLRQTPIPEDELLANLGLYLTSKNLSRLLFFYEIYKKIVHTHGYIFEFGTRWGQNVALLAALRGIFEPFNRNRRIVGFDTFAGLLGLGEADGSKNRCADGAYPVCEGYENELEAILALHEALNPMGHVRKFDLIKGDVRETAPRYFAENPEALVSLAVFDLDIHAPTRAALEAIKPRLYRGSVLVFDELCESVFPGETTALLEVLDVRNLRIERLPMTSRLSYVVLE